MPKYTKLTFAERKSIDSALSEIGFLFTVNDKGSFVQYPEGQNDATVADSLSLAYAGDLVKAVANHRNEHFGKLLNNGRKLSPEKVEKLALEQRVEKLETQVAALITWTMASKGAVELAQARIDLVAMYEEILARG